MVHYCENANCGLPFSRNTKKEKYCHKCRRSGAAYYTPAETVTKVCPICETEFQTNYSRKVYCSKRCRELADTRGNPEVIKKCEYCAKKFTATDTRQKYCGKTCYSLAKAKRSKKNGHDND